MLMPNPSLKSVVFWQFANQTLNVAVNFSNANKVSEDDASGEKSHQNPVNRDDPSRNWHCLFGCNLHVGLPRRLLDAHGPSLAIFPDRQGSTG